MVCVWHGVHVFIHKLAQIWMLWIICNISCDTLVIFSALLLGWQSTWVWDFFWFCYFIIFYFIVMVNTRYKYLNQKKMILPVLFNTTHISGKGFLTCHGTLNPFLLCTVCLSNPKFMTSCVTMESGPTYILNEYTILIWLKTEFCDREKLCWLFESGSRDEFLMHLMPKYFWMRGPGYSW